MSEEEKIIAYVKKHEPRGVRWTDLEKEFCGTRRWSKGKFVNHWKNAKRHFCQVKDPKTGRPRYHIEKEFEGLAEKALLKSNISEGTLIEIAISSERLKQVEHYIIDTLKGQYFLKAFEKVTTEEEKKNAGDEVGGVQIFSRLIDIVREAFRPKDLTPQDAPFVVELTSAYAEEENRARANLGCLLERTKIGIVYSRSETPPTLTDEDIWMLLRVVLPKIRDENKGRIREEPFHLIISFPAQQ